ncbi:MAG: hypothetical protein O3C40_04470 [Planctomycetota bacterium]|nr:hypothetical protein [Planctomycetota bacterium]
MAKPLQVVASGTRKLVRGLLLLPWWLIVWPVVGLWRSFYKHFLAYLIGTKVDDRKRVYSVKFVWYGDSVYLHPMVWGSLLLYVVAITGVVPPGLEAGVTPGFYIAAAYLFAALIASEVVWAWLFHRVELDESYVYEHGFLQGSTREPIFARGMKRETKDLLELLLLGAADIQHRTKNGFKCFKNVPFASLWLGTAIDSRLDHRRKGEVELTSKTEDDAELVRAQDALSELEDDLEEGDDDGGDFGADDTADAA